MTDDSGYPIHVEGHRDAVLSRWLWLVKWLLAVPHYIVLVSRGSRHQADSDGGAAA